MFYVCIFTVFAVFKGITLNTSQIFLVYFLEALGYAPWWLLILKIAIYSLDVFIKFERVNHVFFIILGIYVLENYFMCYS